MIAELCHLRHCMGAVGSVVLCLSGATARVARVGAAAVCHTLAHPSLPAAAYGRDRYRQAGTSKKQSETSLVRGHCENPCLGSSFFWPQRQTPQGVPEASVPTAVLSTRRKLKGLTMTVPHRRSKKQAPLAASAAPGTTLTKRPVPCTFNLLITDLDPRDLTALLQLLDIELRAITMCPQSPRPRQHSPVCARTAAIATAGMSSRPAPYSTVSPSPPRPCVRPSASSKRRCCHDPTAPLFCRRGGHAEPA